MTDTQNALALPDPEQPTGIVALDTPSAELAEIFGENMAGMDITPGDLSRVKIPGSGGKFWQWESSEGPQSTATLDGVIIHRQLTRGWWAKDLDDAGEAPPACSSRDSITARVNQEEIPAGYDGDLPTGTCTTCPLSQFSERLGKTPCQQRMQLFLLPKDEFLPMVIDLPTTSIRPMRRFLLRLASAKKPVGTQVVSLGLTQEKSKGQGITYSLVAPSVLGPLDEHAAMKAKAYAETLIPGLTDPPQAA